MRRDDASRPARRQVGFTSRRSRLFRRVGPVAAIVVAFMAAQQAPGVAAIDPDSYVTSVALFRHPGDGTPGSLGGYVACPAGFGAVSAGASISDGWISGALPVGNGDGAQIYGMTPNVDTDVFLLGSVRCVPKAQLQGSSTVFAYNPSGGLTRVSCPLGTVAYGGGGVQGGPAPGPVAAAAPNADGWMFQPWGHSDAPVALMAHCLPRWQFGQLQVVDQTFAGAQPPGLTSGRARCPMGFAAFAGGAWWHSSSSSEPSSAFGYLTSSVMDADGSGWYAAGYAGFHSFDPAARMTVRVLCMAPRVAHQ